MVRDLEEDKKGKSIKLCFELLLISFIFICLLFAVFLFLSQDSKATYVSGHITSDTTWNASGNPYIIKDDVYVDKDVNLIIEPGVEIKFDGFNELDVEGNLIAVGNETEKITFTSNDSNPSVGDWSCIFIEGYAYIDNCEISYSKTGVYIHCSSNNVILNTNITKCGQGIYLLDASQTTISDVHFWDISNFVLNPMGSGKGYFEYSITNCLVNDRPIYYYYDIHDVTIERLEAGQIIVAGSDNVTIKNCNVTYGSGISLYAVSNSTIYNCNTSYNYVGILLRNPPDNIDKNNYINNIITDNTIYNNTWGIQLYYSEENEIVDSNIISNEWGIGLFNSFRNWIYHNNFIDNVEQVDEKANYSSHNFWDNLEEGNYWDDYYGTDTGGDGIGDSSYWVSYYSRDFFPLMQPYNGSLPPDTTAPIFILNPYINDRSLTLPRDELRIRISSSERGHYEIIIDTDGIYGFNNATDTILRGNTTFGSQDVYWDGQDNEGNYVEDGDHGIQIMIWDRAGNPIAEPYDAGIVSTVRDTDGDGVIDAEDAFPNDPRESEDFDGDGIGDNRDLDWDNDGVQNSNDAFPWDGNEWVDSDDDGIGDNADPDDNDNGIPDSAEIPLVLLILSIPIVAIYFTNKRIVGKKEKEKEEDKEG